jgi:Ca2+-binding EF-hand superfamily protein
MQEFQKAMLNMFGIGPKSKGFKKYCRMVSSWFSQIDTDGSGEIDFSEFEAWYRRTVCEARTLRRANSLDDDVGGIEAELI